MSKEDEIITPQKGIKVGDVIFIESVQEWCDMEHLIGTQQIVFRLFPNRFHPENEDDGYCIQIEKTKHVFREDQVSLLSGETYLILKERQIKDEIKKLQEETEKMVSKIKSKMVELQKIQTEIQNKSEKV